MAKKDERFIVAYKQTTMTTETKVLVDRETGINYLFHQSANSGGLTPLLDREGRPVVTAIWEGVNS